MVAVAINRLRVRGPPESASRTSFLVEDACRTELPDSERLVLVRRLALGPGSTARHPAVRASAMRRAYEEATRGACHGGSDSAAGANCVWFANQAEARFLLMQCLRAGRTPLGWFWRLAVPDWQGQPLAQWFGSQLRSVLETGESDEVLALLIAAAEGGAVDAVMEAVSLATPGPNPAVDHRAFPQALSGQAEQPEEHEARLERIDSLVAQLRGDGTLPFVRVIERIVAQVGAQSHLARLLIERLVLKASPAIALSPPFLKAIVEAYAEMVSQPKQRHVRAPKKEQAAQAHKVPSEHDWEPPARKSSRRFVADTAAKLSPTLQPSRNDLPPIVTSDGEAAPISTWTAPMEQASDAAGLWLAIPSLIRLGIREWLADRPDLLADDAGRVLIRTIARHHRVEEDDPALLPVIVDDRPFTPPAWALEWRVALDRWLRRQARIPLAGLVWRPGWMHHSGERLMIRFPLAAADIRLRRRALDVDPGWIDWLGLSVRYLYAERPVQ